MTNSSPLITIIIPTYNSQEFISQTLDSVINQTYKNWEVLIIDDGSTDSTLSFILSINEERVEIFKRDRLPKGASTCRNIGIEKSKGKYIIFLDSDDLLKANAIENRIHIMETNSHLDFAVFKMGFFKNVLYDCNRKPNSMNNKAKHLEKFLLLEAPFYITGPIWRKESLLKTGGFNETLMRFQDTELHLKALSISGVEYITKNTVDSYYRIPDKKLPHEKRSLVFLSMVMDNLINFINYFLIVEPILLNKNQKKTYSKLMFKAGYMNYINFINNKPYRVRYIKRIIALLESLPEKNRLYSQFIRLSFDFWEFKYVPLPIKKSVFRIIMWL